MSEDKPEFGNPEDIAWERMNKSQRDSVLKSPDGRTRMSVKHEALSQEDFENMFGELPPAEEGNSKEISLKAENKTYPQFTIPEGATLFNGWYGDSETEEIGKVNGEKGEKVEVLEVRRPERGKGPAPSWKIQRTSIKDGEIHKDVLFVGRRGKNFIGAEPKE